MAREGAREIVFVTGGARSGKSRFAQARAEGWAGPLLYIATAETLDDEMRERVEKHRAERGERWETLEEPLALSRALGVAEGYGGALLDCLTLWTSNLLGLHGEDQSRLQAAVDAFLDSLDGFRGRICVVTNEVGAGIVPENPLARRFRDLAGRLNQEAARRATQAFLIVSGLAVRLK